MRFVCSYHVVQAIAEGVRYRLHPSIAVGKEIYALNGELEQRKYDSYKTPIERVVGVCITQRTSRKIQTLKVVTLKLASPHTHQMYKSSLQTHPSRTYPP